FTLDLANAREVALICARMDGLPLAVELAASGVRAFTPHDLAARLSDRFRLAIGSGRSGPGRHETLRGAISWSYELLPAAERTLFNQLAVFVGGFTLEAAEMIATVADVAELLVGLVAKSLVVADVRGLTTRYSLLETLREYAAERLTQNNDTEATAARHAEYFATLAEQAQDVLRGHGQAEWFARLEQDL